MATVEPFAAMRPRPELAGRICELPYDVMSSEEARRIAAGNPFSFLHVSRPEIDLPPSASFIRSNNAPRQSIEVLSAAHNQPIWLNPGDLSP